MYISVSTSVCLFLPGCISSALSRRVSPGIACFCCSNNSVFESDLLFCAPDSARFELLMSWFSLPLGSSGNSWPQSGLINMHDALHPAFCFLESAPKLVSLERLSALEGFVDSAPGGFTTPDDVN